MIYIISTMVVAIFIYFLVGRIALFIFMGLDDDRELDLEFKYWVSWPIPFIVILYQSVSLKWFDRFFWQVGYRIRNFFKKT